MLTHNQAQSMRKDSPKIISRILVVIVCVISVILISLVDLRTTINSLTIELMSDQERSFRLYYDTGSGYNEQESVGGEVLRRDKQATTYHFPIPSDKTLIAIRIDPDEQPAQYLIKTISLNYLYDSKRVYPHLTWNAGQIEKLFVPLHNVKPFVLQQGYLLVETEGPDPHFGTKENLSETWKKLRNEQHPLLLPLKIGGYLLLALISILFFFYRYVSRWLKKVSNLWITQHLLNFVCRDLFRDINLSQCVILGVVFLAIVAMLFHFALPLNIMIQSFVISSFLVWIVSLLGLGCFISEFIKRFFKDFEIADEFKISYYGILGLIIVSFIGTIFNIFIPLNSTFSSIILIIGIVLFLVYRKNILLSYRRYDIIIIFTLFAYSSILSLMDLEAYDTGFYHLPMINWISNSALPFGLANLHDRFGFNSSWFIDAAIVSPLRLITKSPFFIINAMIFFFYGTSIFLTLSRMIKERKVSFPSIFIITTFIPWFYCLAHLISSPSPDVPTMLLTLFVTFLLIRTFETNNADYLFISLIISFYIVTIKLSAIPYFPGIFFILLLLLIFKNYLKKTRNLIIEKISKAKCIVTGIILSIIAIPYFIRGIISSGYIAFPSTFVHLNLKWAVPIDSAIETSNWVESWAKKTAVPYYEVLGNWNWLEHWLNQKITDEWLWITFAIVGMSFFVLSLILKKKKYINVFLIIFFLSLLGCIFWFFVAPDPRFGYGYLYSFSGILLSFGIYNMLTDKKYVSIILKSILAVIIMLFIFQNNTNFSQLMNTNKVKGVDLVENKTEESVSIFTPNNKGEQCFDTPLMCTPIFNKNLKVVFDKNNNPRMFWIQK